MTQLITDVYRDLLVALLADAVNHGVLVYLPDVDVGDAEPITFLLGPLDDDFNMEMITEKRHVILPLDKLASEVVFRKGDADA